MVRKGVFWNIGELSYFGLLSYYVLSKDKVYRVETMDMVRFLWNNGVGVK